MKKQIKDLKVGDWVKHNINWKITPKLSYSQVQKVNLFTFTVNGTKFWKKNGDHYLNDNEYISIVPMRELHQQIQNQEVEAINNLMQRTTDTLEKALNKYTFQPHELALIRKEMKKHFTEFNDFMYDMVWSEDNES